jgi:parallel beta-helix repeat protein
VTRFLIRAALALLIAASTLAGTTEVTTTADSGSGSLRQALLDAASGACASPCTIAFALSGHREPDGWYRIAPTTPLPNLTAPGTVVDATTQTAIADSNPRGPEVALDGSALAEMSGLRLIGCDRCSVRGLAIFDFPGHGILVQDSREASVQESWLGFFPGWSGRGNRMDGVVIVRSSGTIVRDSLISANRSNGVYVTDSTGTIIRGNRIGTTFIWISDLGNAANGIHLQESRDSIIEDNDIAFNRHHGVSVAGEGRGNRFTRNRIHSNGLLGIDLGRDGRDPIDPGDLDDGPNGRTNAPAVTSVEGNCSEATIRGRIDARPSTAYRIEAFSVAEPDIWGTGEGGRYLGAIDVTTDSSGSAQWAIAADDDLDRWITATATDEDGSTSEFSAALALEDPACADLSVELSYGRAHPVPAGDVATFAAFVYNLGPHSSGARELTVRIDAGTIIDTQPNSGSSCTIVDPREARCTIPPLPFPAPSVSIGFRVETPNQSTTVHATATLSQSASSPDPVSSNDTASLQFEVSALPNLVHSLEIPWGENNPGDRLVFPVHIRNDGSGDAGGVVLTIETRPAVAVEEVAALGWECSPLSNGIRCTHPAITGGARGTIHFALVLPSSGRLKGPIEVRTSLTSTSGDFAPEDIEQLAYVPFYRARFVTNLDDSGAGSLRQAMIDVQEPDCIGNAPCKIMFRIPQELATNGVYTIRPRTPLPPIRQPYVVIDGFTQTLFAGDTNPAGPEIEINGSLSQPGSGVVIELEGTLGGVALRALTINGWEGNGVELTTGELGAYHRHNFLRGLFIGTDPTGTRSVPNRGHGAVLRVGGISSTTTVSCYPSDRGVCEPSIIGGNEGDGLWVEGPGEVNIGNVRIGTMIVGVPIPNRGNGVTLSGGARGNFAASWIETNEGDGIRLLTPGTVAYLDRTSIRANGGLGIDAGEDGVSAEEFTAESGFLNAPEVVSASFDAATGRTTVVVTVPGLAPLEQYHFRDIQIFASPEPDPSGYGEGARQLQAFLRSSPFGDRTFEIEVLGDPRGEWITAVIYEYIQQWDALRRYVRMSEFGKAFRAP